MLSPALRARERDALIQSLRAGVTPRLGARHIQVGRDAEIAALDQDLDRIADGGTAFRLVIGEYGSGKTFFLNLVRGEAMNRQLVVAHADLSPDRRLQASAGKARSLYAELPLDLLPNAVIAELNERALNLTGELALEENDDEITIAYDVLTQVISTWKDV
ncbi:hypothetical protein ACCAA_760020 [Candidatus Accumulibacter aalborgensis]|uniref:ATP-binding protein n=1 Tax=Candidatus Accumulibacter aalborgensis TaxID=1860102 RepID=A0A1A8XXL2_9PROT|nr:BREX system ATP-binding domain-containing protein [Candidatus Accumulibacter aalborgensis]SBT09724.1 hypothetical protein ACCAA_760020 [Candidatus Accumulibacter aalborgensis]